MASQLKQLRLSRGTRDYGFVRTKRKSGRSRSPDDDDVDRIIQDYVDDDYLRSVINKKTSVLAVESLIEGKAKRGNATDFFNFVSAVGKGKIAERIYELYSEENVLNLLTQEIQLKTKTIRGFALNEEIYIRETKAGLRAYGFKDNRFTKLPRNLFR